MTQKHQLNYVLSQEVNIPRDATCYKDLIPVGVSDDSFQKLTFKPRLVKRTRLKETKEPNITDLYPYCIVGLSQSPPKNIEVQNYLGLSVPARGARARARSNPVYLRSGSSFYGCPN